MTIYQVPKSKFLTVKKYLDQAVFWRQKDSNTIEVRPVFKYAKEIVKQISIN